MFLAQCKRPSFTPIQNNRLNQNLVQFNFHIPRATNVNTEDAIERSLTLIFCKFRHAWNFDLLLSDSQTLRIQEVEKQNEQWTGRDAKGRQRDLICATTTPFVESNWGKSWRPVGQTEIKTRMTSTRGVQASCHGDEGRNEGSSTGAQYVVYFTLRPPYTRLRIIQWSEARGFQSLSVRLW